jgi:prepilin-type N-terminal cleavage/methylation domain-containing protein
MRSRKGGFTLVELMVVAVIVAILAAVAIPLMSANKKRAMSTEAQAGLGTIRTALRAMYAETGRYDQNQNAAVLTASSKPWSPDLPGISQGDLDGRYFDHSSYTISAISSNSYTILATGSSGTLAPDRTQVAGVIVQLTDAGQFTYTGL